MKTLTKLLAIPLMITLVWGMPQKYLPEQTKREEIEQMPCEKNNCCIHKSVMFSDYLNKKGYNSRIVVGKRNKSKHTLHAWLQIEKEGEWYRSDPTFKGDKEEGHKSADYNDRKIYIIFKKNSEAMEIKDYLTVDKIFYENMIPLHKEYFKKKFKPNKNLVQLK